MWNRLNSYRTTFQCHDVSHSNSSSSHAQLELYHASGKLREKSSVLSSRLKAGRALGRRDNVHRQSVPDSCHNDWKGPVSDGRQPRSTSGRLKCPKTMTVIAALMACP